MMDPAEAVTQERQRLAGIFLGMSDDARAARAKFTHPRSRAAGVIEQEIKLLASVIQVIRGRDHAHPYPMPDIGVRADALTASAEFQYIGRALNDAKAGDKIAVRLNEDGALWASNQDQPLPPDLTIGETRSPSAPDPHARAS